MPGRELLLGHQHGPWLVQLGREIPPASWDAIAAFLAALPAGLRWAIEFRHRGWFGPKLLALLEKHRVALALVEGRWLARERVIDLAIRPTADFAYVRWMGTGGGARIGDFSRVQVNRDRELSASAAALAALAARVTDVHGYFRNHFQGHPPAG